MKKLFKILSLVLIAAVCAIGLFACDNGGNGGKKTGLQYKMYEGDDYYTVYDYVKDGDETELDIGSYNKDGVVIKRIKKGAFKDNDNLVKITVPDTVEIIDGGAFANMKALKEITLPFIGHTPVADVGSVNSAPDDKATEKSVGNERNFGYIFGTEEYEGGVKCDQNYDASNTSTYYLPETLRKVNLTPKASSEYGIPMYAFSGNAWVNEVVLSADVKAIGVAAFKDNVYAATINLSGVEKIYDDAFNGAKNLIAADLTGLTEIKETCFKNCAALTTVGINVDIPAGTFYGCANLTTVTIGANVVNIGANAFYGCDAVTTITVNGTNEWTVGTTPNVILNAANVKNADYSILKWSR